MVKREVELIGYFTDKMEKVSAFYSYPTLLKKYPVIIYNHGSIIERMGHEDAVNNGYNLKLFVESISKCGYIGIAPIRKSAKDIYKEARLNDRIISATIRYLKKQKNVDAEKIGIIGFSRGGVISLDFILRRNNIGRAVIMSAPISVELIRKLGNTDLSIFFTCGKFDNPLIIKSYKKIFKKNIKNFKFNFVYPGDHKWFWKVRQEYWHDIIDFFDDHFKKIGQ